MTASQFIIQCIKGYKIPFYNDPYQNNRPKNKALSFLEEKKTLKAIQLLLKKEAIEECTSVEGEFFSPYFLREKPDGSDRFIFNLKGLKKFIDPPQFKIEDVKTALRLITKGCFMASMELQDAYMLIPMSLEDRKFLRFSFQNTLYQYICMPFGLCTAPRTRLRKF